MPYHEFLDKGNAFISWIELRLAIVKDSVPRDTKDLEPLIKKHRHIELEIRSSTSYFNYLVSSGEELQVTKNKECDVSSVLAKIKALWSELIDKIKDKLLELDQTTAYKLFCTELDLINHQFDHVKAVLERTVDKVLPQELKNYGKELKGCSSILNFVEGKMKELNSMGEKIISYNHSSSADVKRFLDEVKQTYGYVKV